MEKNKNFYQKKRLKDLIFCLCVIAVPALQFAIFYIGVNFNSILMAFQKYDNSTIPAKYVWNGVANFKTLFNDLANSTEIHFAFKNSLLVFLVNVGVGTTLSLVFSLYIYKKMIFSKTFRALLFAPSILSIVVMTLMYQKFVEAALPAIFPSMDGLLGNPDTKMGTLLFFMVWIGFGTQILMYSGAMNTIEDSVIEAAKLDGASPLREFVSIILPLIYPTIVTFMVTNLAGLFTNQLNLHAFYGNSVESRYITIGFYLFRETNGGTASYAQYPLLATYSILLTVIAVPLTLFGRKFLEKIGPKTE